MTLIPKEGDDYCGIRLMDLVWKVVTVIINHRLSTTISIHDMLHGFRAVHSTGTASLEAKLPQQLTAMREEVLCATFMDLHKSYDALDRDILLEIIERY